MDAQTLLYSVAPMLEVPALAVGPDQTLSIELEAGHFVSLDFSEWPLIRLYRSLPLSLHGDEEAVYRKLLEWNSEWHGPSLACDESGELYLVHTLNGHHVTPESLGEGIRQFTRLGASLQERIRLGDNDDAGVLHEEPPSEHEAPPEMMDSRWFA